MDRRPGIDRQQFVHRVIPGVASLMLSGCDRLSASGWFTHVLDCAESVSRYVQAAITPRGAPAREYTEADLSPQFKSNGTNNPDDPIYQALAQNNSADWRLKVDGQVTHPLRLSLDNLRALPSRTQITRHDCVEGWSCIGKWKGVPLSAVLNRAGPRPHAQYVVFYSADALEGDKYYEASTLSMPIILRPSSPTR